MTLSEQTRRKILVYSIMAISFGAVALIPFLIIYWRTDNPLWLLLLIVLSWGVNAIGRALRNQAIRADIADYPVKPSQYSPAQKAWLQRYNKEFSNKQGRRAFLFSMGQYPAACCGSTRFESRLRR